jgi:hypothetical protein
MFNKDLTVSCHIAFRLPNGSYIFAGDVETIG